MDHDRFRDWFSRVDELTAAQRKEVAAVLSDPPAGAASLAAIELGVDDGRRCSHCGAGGAVSRGKARGLRRFWCKECGKTFGALTGAALSGLHHKERWLAFGASLGTGETIKESAERQPRRRGGKAKKHGLSREQVPILVAADRGGATPSHTLPALNADSVKDVLEPVLAPDALLVSDANRCYPPVAAALDIPHESINASAGERVRAAHPDGQQPPQPDQGLPARLPRHRHQVPRQLSEVVPSHRTRRPTIAKSLPRGGNDEAMPRFHELNQVFWLVRG